MDVKQLNRILHYCILNLFNNKGLKYFEEDPHPNISAVGPTKGTSSMEARSSSLGEGVGRLGEVSFSELMQEF